MFGDKKKRRKAPWWIRLLMVLGIFAALYIIGGFVVLPLMVRPMLQEKLSDALKRPVEIRSLAVNPISLAVTLEGVKVLTEDGSGVTASFESLFLDAEYRSLFKKAVVIREITLINPYVNVIRRDDNTYNFSYLMTPDKGAKPKEKSAPINFSVNNIRIVGGSADFRDNPTGLTHSVRSLDVSVPFVSNFGYYHEVFVEPSFGAVINGTPFKIEGKTKPFSDSLQTEFELKFNDLDIPFYASYAPVDTGFEVVSGRFSTDVKVDYLQYIGKDKKEIKVFGLLSMRDLKVTDKEGGGLVELPGLDIDITNIDPLNREVKLSSVRLDRPGLNVVREPDGSINLANALPKSEKAEKPQAEPDDVAPRLVLAVNVLTIDSGRIYFEDRTVSGPFRATVEPLDVTVVNFKNIRGWKTSVNVEALTDAGERLLLSSGVTADPVGAEGTVSLTGVPVTRYAAYFPEALRAKIESAMFGLGASFTYNTDPDNKRMSVEGLEAALSSFRLRAPGDPKTTISLGGLTVSDAAADVLGREAKVGGIKLEDGLIEVIRGKDGVINLARIYAPPAGENEEPVAETGPPDEAKPWEVTVADFGLSGFEVGFHDDYTQEPVDVRAKAINLAAHNVSTVKDAAGDVSLGLLIGSKGKVKVSGPVTVNPPSAKLGVNVDGFGLARYQPYVPAEAGIVLTDGYVMVKGELDYAKLDTGPKVEFAGDASVTSLKIVDTIGYEDMLTWKSLYLSGIKAGNEPVHADMNEVALTDFYAMITVTKDGRVNILPNRKPATEEVEVEEGAPPAEPEPEPEPAPAEEKKPGFRADIKRVTLQGGHVVFNDRSLEKTFTAKLTELGGRVSGLTSKETELAEVDVKAKYNDFAPIEITGRVNPLRDDLYVDLKARFVDMDLTPLTPYTNKYIGYPISKGKLSLNLEYHIANRKLDSQNVVFVDQLTLGDRVDSPTATSLPVKLAIALLRDRNGEIHIDLPVTGDLDSPEFSIWGLAFQVVVNLVTKAATSPFALLGAVIGGGEELGYVEFGYGSSELDGPGADKIGKLAEALYERPALKLSISGYVDPELDHDAIRQARFEHALKVEKFRETVGDIEEGEEGAKAVSEIEILPEEYETYLTLAYEEADFPKPRNIIGMMKDLPREEMEKLMLTNTVVTDDDLGALAYARAAVVQEKLMATGKMEAERVFLVKPESMKAEEKTGVKYSRVEFSLE